MAAEDVEERTRDKVIEYQKVAQEEAVEEEQFLTFQITSEDYGIELVQSKEVIKYPKLPMFPILKNMFWE